MSEEERLAYDERQKKKDEKKALKEKRIEEEFLVLRQESEAIRQANLQ